ncbi:MAG: sugar transferase [Cyclobacteriaceae bacterium]|nr:sugar transferase [Cyclobacteriaceae bacterium]UYN85583.1 MAG: sugar transferase [Cyclobacteriaceae bacterium]
MTYRQSGKLVVDKIIAVLFVVCTSWLILLIFLLYAISLEFPFLYQSQRIGREGVPFRMFKFRTLKANEQLPLKDRQFWLGKFLRTTNLDELPQLWNVLKGEMSLIGPRPLPVTYAPLLSAEQQQRHRVLPGITGLAQVNGKNSLPWEKKFEYDLAYIQQVSFLLDIQILFKTVALILSFKRDVSLDERGLNK